MKSSLQVKFLSGTGDCLAGLLRPGLRQTDDFQPFAMRGTSREHGRRFHGGMSIFLHRGNA
jgi:hypothetical protein